MLYSNFSQCFGSDSSEWIIWLDMDYNHYSTFCRELAGVNTTKGDWRPRAYQNPKKPQCSYLLTLSISGFWRVIALGAEVSLVFD